MDHFEHKSSFLTRSRSCNSTTSTTATTTFNNNNGSSHKSKLARTFQKVINLRTGNKTGSNNGGVGSCVFPTQHKSECYYPNPNHKISSNCENRKQKAIFEALIAKIFASVTSIKAGYAELQMAQNPYNNDAIQAADEAIVEELRTLSELKRKFLKKELDLSPQVTIMLAEIQEQQSLMKTYEITMKKLESDVETRDSEISSLRKRIQDWIDYNKSLEKKLNASGPLSMFDHYKFTTLRPSHFVQVLHKTLRSVRSFVRIMIKEMELANWDIDAAVKAIESGGVVLVKEHHRCFVLESFVCKTMLEGFNLHDFGIYKDLNPKRPEPEKYFNEFKTVKATDSKIFLAQNPKSSFAKFTRIKYLSLVHAKMECSFFGNLNQRKIITSGGFSVSIFFQAFAEMAKRFWLLHCLAFSLSDQVSIFEVKKNSRFSEVYMENVGDDETLFSGEVNDGNVDIRVSFTVVPGFKIGKTVVQSQVYLSSVINPSMSR